MDSHIVESGEIRFSVRVECVGTQPQFPGKLKQLRSQGGTDGLEEAAAQCRTPALTFFGDAFAPAGGQADGDILVNGMDRFNDLLSCDGHVSLVVHVILFIKAARLFQGCRIINIHLDVHCRLVAQGIKDLFKRGDLDLSFQRRRLAALIAEPGGVELFELSKTLFFRSPRHIGCAFQSFIMKQYGHMIAGGTQVEFNEVSACFHSFCHGKKGVFRECN